MAAASGTVWCVFSAANWSPISDSALLLQRAPSPFNFLPTRAFGISGVGIRANTLRIGLHSPPPPLAVMAFSESPIVRDAAATLISGSVALFLLRLWEETARRKFFDQELNRKLVHVSIGLAFMLCWPLFSSRYEGAVLASLIPGANVIRMLVIGLGIWKDEATVKSMSRFGDRRELLRGPLFYACTCTLVCVIYWRTSPVAIAAMCNLCAGDGFADIVGRRIGRNKISYNKNKSIAGSIAMAVASFLSSVGLMYYFSSLGFLRGNREMVFGFLATSLAAALVESLPISSEIDDNLTVPVSSVLVGSLIF